jgi:hypothetical protein
MCINSVEFRGTSLRCGDTVSFMDTNGIVRREVVCCYSCAKEAALRWSMARCERYLSEFWDADDAFDLQMPRVQAA